MSEEELDRMPRMARVLRLDELLPILKKMKEKAKKGDRTMNGKKCLHCSKCHQVLDIDDIIVFESDLIIVECWQCHHETKFCREGNKEREE